MWAWIKEKLKAVWVALWCHRASHAVMAVVYGCYGMELIGTLVLASAVAAIYTAMVFQRH